MPCCVSHTAADDVANAAEATRRISSLEPYREKDLDGTETRDPSRRVDLRQLAAGPTPPFAIELALKIVKAS